MKAWADKFHLCLLCVHFSLLDKAIVSHWGLRYTQISPVSMTTKTQYLTNGHLSHVWGTIWSLSVCFSLAIFILTAYVHTHIHAYTHKNTPLCALKLTTLPALEISGKGDPREFIMSLISLLAAQTFGEQSRYYFKTIPANRGVHYLIYNHENWEW